MKIEVKEHPNNGKYEEKVSEMNSENVDEDLVCKDKEEVN